MVVEQIGPCLDGACTDLVHDASLAVTISIDLGVELLAESRLGLRAADNAAVGSCGAVVCASSVSASSVSASQAGRMRAGGVGSRIGSSRMGVSSQTSRVNGTVTADSGASLVSVGKIRVNTRISGVANVAGMGASVG